MSRNNELISRLKAVIDTDLPNESLIAFINSILHDEGGIIYDYGIDLIKLMLRLKAKLDDPLQLSGLIESIMTAVGITGYFSEYYSKNHILDFAVLFDEYIGLMQKTGYTDRSVQVLHCFSEFGIAKTDIINTTAEKLSHNDTIMLFCGLISLFYPDDILNDTNYSEKATELLKRASVYNKKRERIHIIEQLILITHPQYKDMYRFAGFAAGHSCYENVLSDWYFTEKGSSQRFVNENILTEREGLILEKLGQLILCGEMSSDKLEKLYEAFCDGKNIAELYYG